MSLILKSIIPSNVWLTIKAYVDNALASSVSKGYASYSLNGGTDVTTFALQNTYYKLSAVTIVGLQGGGLASSTTQRITNTSANSKKVKLDATISITGSNNNNIHFAFFLDGALISSSEDDVTIPSGGRISSIPLQCLVEVPSNSYVEIYVKNSNATNQITLGHLNVIATEV
jgi:hypothetical protein